MTAQNEAWPFREPVKAEEVPDYYTLVKACSPSAPLQWKPRLSVCENLISPYVRFASSMLRMPQWSEAVICRDTARNQTCSATSTTVDSPSWVL